jgi:5'-nucleotidase
MTIQSDSVDTKRAWIQTYSGGKFHILDPQQDEILITDVGHSLAMQCRFTGHVRRFYSVAEHCVLGSRLVPIKDALWFLLHDSSETWIADVNRPLKHFTGIGPEYMPIEAKIMEAVCQKFRLPVEEPPSIKKVDNAMLFAEKEQLLVPMEWDTKWGDIKPADIKVKCWAPEVAEIEFLHRFYELTGSL